MSVTASAIRTFKTAADYSAKRYYIVKQTAAGVVTLASAATDVILGVITTTPAAATGASVGVQLRGQGGTGKVIAGGALSSLNAMLTSDADGKAIATTTTGNQVFGINLQTAATGDIFEYLPVHHIVD